MKPKYGHYAKMLSCAIDQRIIQASAKELRGGQGYMLIFISKKGGKVLQSDIEKQTPVRRSSISVLLKNLEKEGFIHKSDVEGDKRKKMISLTEKGDEFLGKVKNAIDETEKELTKGINEEDLGTYQKVCQAMLINLKGGEKA